MSAFQKFTLLMKNPQNWIDAIFVLTVLGLGTGLFEQDERRSDRDAVSVEATVLAEMTVAELTPHGVRP